MHILTDRYGTSDVQTAALYSELFDLARASPKFPELRCLADHLERIVWQVGQYGDDVSGQKGMLQAIRSKVPSNVQIELQKGRDQATAWTEPTFIESFQDYLKIREKV